MCLRSKVIGILLLQSVALYSQTVAKVEIQKTVYDPPTGDKISEDLPEGPPLLNQNGLAYAFCPDPRNADPVAESHCTLVLGNSTDNLRFCNVTVSDNRYRITTFWSYYQFGKDKMILHWMNNGDKFGYGIVEFSNCLFTPVNGTYHGVYDTGFTIVMPLNDYIFDIIYLNSFDGCNDWCRITLNDKGNVLANPKHELNSSDYVAVAYSPTKGRLVVILPRGMRNVLQVASENDDGTIEILKEFPSEKGYLAASHSSVSTTYQLLTICSAVNLTVFCGQFDDNGTLKLENSIQISHVHNVNQIKVYNMLHGGFLMLLKSEGDQPIFVTKVNAAGQEVGTLQLPQFPCYNHGIDFQLFTNIDKEPCLTEVCKNKDHLSFNHACYPDKEFGK